MSEEEKKIDSPVQEGEEGSEGFEKDPVTGKGTATSAENQIENLPDSVGESLEALVSVVLDSAEVANKSANVAASSTGTLNAGIEKLNAAARKNARNSLVILGVCGLFLIIGAMLFAFMTTKLNSRIGQVDAMLLAVGKRVLEMDSGVDALGEMQSTLDKFNVDQLQLQEQVNITQEELKNKISEAIDVSNGLATALPEKTADQVQQKTNILVKQVEELTEKVKGQESLIGRLKSGLEERLELVDGSMKTVQQGLNEVNAVKRDVEALVVIQKDRYLEKLEAAIDEEKNIRIAEEKAKSLALQKKEVVKQLRYPRENTQSSMTSE